MMSLDEIVETFEFFDSWEDKYRFIIELGKELPELNDTYKTDDNLVRGCQSQVWLHYELDERSTPPNLQLQMDSDAFIVRGLIHIVTAAYAGKNTAQISAFDIEALFEQLDLLAHLSATRGNGLRAMVERIQSIANQC